MILRMAIEKKIEKILTLTKPIEEIQYLKLVYDLDSSEQVRYIASLIDTSWLHHLWRKKGYWLAIEWLIYVKC